MSDLLFELFPELKNSVYKPRKPRKFFPVDIYENEDQYVVDAYFPGYPKSSISLNTENRVLTIKAKAKDVKDNLVVSELGINVIGDLERSFQLADDVDDESITAALKNGILTVTLPKLEAKKAKDIKIK